MFVSFLLRKALFLYSCIKVMNLGYLFLVLYSYEIMECYLYQELYTFITWITTFEGSDVTIVQMLKSLLLIILRILCVFEVSPDLSLS